MRGIPCPATKAVWSAGRSPRSRAAWVLAALTWLLPAQAVAQDIVLHAIDVTTIRGNWARVDSWSAADNKKMQSTDQGWSAKDAPLANPTHYFEASFEAQAGVAYRFWLRLRSTNNTSTNDSVWVQFSDSVDGAGNARYRIGTADALGVNLETCEGCGVSEWGWWNGVWWKDQDTLIQFASAGQKTIRIQTREDGVQIDQIVLSASTYLFSPPGPAKNDTTIVPRSTASSASLPAAKSVPGTIEAEDFDNGPNGTAYYDQTPGNAGGQYRATDVDIAQTPSGGYTVGWAGAGEWLAYTINVTAAGRYRLVARVASPASGGTFHVEFNGQNKTGTMQVPATGGWQVYQDVAAEVSLDAGVQVMRLVLDSNAPSTGATGNFNFIRLETSSGSSGSSGTSGGSGDTRGPFGGTPWAIPGTVQAEDFDSGGNGVAYYDNSPGNAGGQYRATDVDIAQTASGGYTVGWAGAGEWLAYTVNVASAGPYRLVARVASPASGGAFHVEFGGQDKTGTMWVPATGGWGVYQDVAANVWLDAGVQVMRLVLDANAPSTGAVANFHFIRLEAASSTPPPSSPSPSPPSGGRLRIMTWNIHFGRTLGGVFDTWGQARVMADSGADVILLQEAQTWDEDMPRAFPDKLRQLTGQTWYAVWSPNNLGGGGSQGTLILSRLPIVSSSTAIFDNASMAQAQIDVGGVRVHVFDVHLEYYDTSKRTRQLYAMMDWARGYGGPRIVGGDFNSWWGEWWIRQMETEYSDTWQDVTGSDEYGYTIGNVRFDYLFRAFDQNWRLTPTACWVIDTSQSDHRPVVADYQVQ
ncbi:MAG TPA: carbohydrate-binding protein [Vicinamibacterales bacterium]|nr:carbohydrate-binding protein [Vicinamibacterales bacterium]